MLDSSMKVRIISHCIIFIYTIVSVSVIHSNETTFDMISCYSNEKLARKMVTIPSIICSIVIMLCVGFELYYKATLYTSFFEFVKFWKIQDIDTRKEARKEVSYVLLVLFLIIGCNQTVTVLLFSNTLFSKALLCIFNNAFITILSLLYFMEHFNLFNKCRSFVVHHKGSSETDHLL